MTNYTQAPCYQPQLTVNAGIHTILLSFEPLMAYEWTQQIYNRVGM